jgi:hypothetical protein
MKKQYYILYDPLDNTYLCSISKHKTVKERSTNLKTKAKKFSNLNIAEIYAEADHVMGKRHIILKL